MARTETAGNLVERAIQRADMENSNFIGTDEKYRALNVWTAKLWNKLLKIDPDRYTREETFSGDGSTRDFDVASDYYGTAGVDYIVDSTSGIYTELPRIYGAEESNFAQLDTGEPRAYTYRYNATTPSTPKVRILPTPSSGDDCRHRYLVAPPSYATDGTDSAELVAGIAGFEEYVVIGMAIDFRIKEESSVVQLRQSLVEMDMHLEEMAENRSVNEAGRVVETRNVAYDDDPADWSPYRRG